MIRDIRRDGPETLARFNAPDRLVWYFEAITDALQEHAGLAPIAEIRAGAVQLRILTQDASPGI